MIINTEPIFSKDDPESIQFARDLALRPFEEFLPYDPELEIEDVQNEVLEMLMAAEANTATHPDQLETLIVKEMEMAAGTETGITVDEDTLTNFVYRLSKRVWADKPEMLAKVADTEVKAIQAKFGELSEEEEKGMTGLTLDTLVDWIHGQVKHLHPSLKRKKIHKAVHRMLNDIEHMRKHPWSLEAKSMIHHAAGVPNRISMDDLRDFTKRVVSAIVPGARLRRTPLGGLN